MPKLKLIKIKKISLKGIYETKNIRVFKNKNFILANGILTHNSNNAQGALRGIIEDYSKNCRFILSANYENKIIEALHSRLTRIPFGDYNK